MKRALLTPLSVLSIAVSASAVTLDEPAEAPLEPVAVAREIRALLQHVLIGVEKPEQALPTWLISLAVQDLHQFEEELRLGDPAVVGRIEDGRLVLDLRTVFEEEEEELIAALNQARSK